MSSYYGSEVIDTMLQEKPLKLQIVRIVPNRHRWSGREYQGIGELNLKN